MALKQADKDKLKATYKFDVDKLIAAVTAADEQDLEFPADITVIPNADLTARDENMKLAGKKDGEAIGEVKGKEITVKKIAKKN